MGSSHGCGGGHTLGLCSPVQLFLLALRVEMWLRVHYVMQYGQSSLSGVWLDGAVLNTMKVISGFIWCGLFGDNVIIMEKIYLCFMDVVWGEMQFGGVINVLAGLAAVHVVIDGNLEEHNISLLVRLGTHCGGGSPTSSSNTHWGSWMRSPVLQLEGWR
eukprot:797725-Ditylum_brightwellii.AAC.1